MQGIPCQPPPCTQPNTDGPIASRRDAGPRPKLEGGVGWGGGGQEYSQSLVDDSELEELEESEESKEELELKPNSESKRAHIRALHTITTFIGGMVLSNNIIITTIISGKATLKTPTLPLAPLSLRRARTRLFFL